MLTNIQSIEVGAALALLCTLQKSLKCVWRVFQIKTTNKIQGNVLEWEVFYSVRHWHIFLFLFIYFLLQYQIEQTAVPQVIFNPHTTNASLLL